MDEIGEAMLEIKNYTKCFGSKKAVDNLSLKVEAGDIFGFIGHNGAGKSTTIKAAVGILDFTDGDILINGHSIKQEPMACKKCLAYIPDNPDLYENMTGIQYLNFIADIFQIESKKREERIKEYADMLELTGALGDLIGAYSHGMKQKLAIIAALLHKPKLIIMDEPFVGLDPKATVMLKHVMKEMCENGGAIFFSTHVLEVAEKLCNKIAIIKDGKLVAQGKTETVIGDSSLEDLFMEVVGND